MRDKMTIDKLARMSQDEFAKIDERFETIDKRFEDVDKRFDKVDKTLETILDIVLEIPSKKSFDRLEDKVSSIDIRLSSVERKIK